MLIPVVAYRGGQVARFSQRREQGGNVNNHMRGQLMRSDSVLWGGWGRGRQLPYMVARTNAHKYRII